MCIKLLSPKKYCVSSTCSDHHSTTAVTFVSNKTPSTRENHKNSNTWEWECTENLKTNQRQSIILTASSFSGFKLLEGIASKTPITCENISLAKKQITDREKKKSDQTNKGIKQLKPYEMEIEFVIERLSLTLPVAQNPCRSFDPPRLTLRNCTD